MVTRCGVSSGQKIETFLDNLPSSQAFFLGLSFMKPSLEQVFPKAKLCTPFLLKKFAFPRTLDWL
jgi:hypothetical protein